MSRPPIGIMPRELWEEWALANYPISPGSLFRRVRGLQRVIREYGKAGLNISPEWEQELEFRLKGIRNYPELLKQLETL